MKKLFLSVIILTFLNQHKSDAQVMWEISPSGVTQWYYNSGDEFNTNSVDTSLWRDSYPWGRTLYCNYEQQYYSKWDNVEQSNGTLKLIAKKETKPALVLDYEKQEAQLKCGDRVIGINKQLFEYTSGMIFSKNKYHYGYYEMRFKSDAAKGMWPAFWLYAGHDNEEIDIFELKGEKNSSFHVDVHCPSGCDNYKTFLGIVKKNWGGFLPVTGNWGDGFNIVSIEWQPEYIKWFVNGRGVAYWKGNFPDPMWIIANLAVPSDNGPFKPGPGSDTPFPNKFEIDYIRFWTKEPSTTKQASLYAHNEKDSQAILTGSGKAIPAKKVRPEFKKKMLPEATATVSLSKSGEDIYSLGLNGFIGKDLSIKVTDSNGKIVYQSSDQNVLEHHFRIKQQNGKSLLEVKLNKKSFTYKF